MIQNLILVIYLKQTIIKHKIIMKYENAFEKIYIKTNDCKMIYDKCHGYIW